MQLMAQFPQGFRSHCANVGVKPDKPDCAVVVSDAPCTAAGVFTRNTFCGSAITVGREHIADGRLQALVVISGNANVATGEQGMQHTREVAAMVAEATGVTASDVLPSFTGVIGRALPMPSIRQGLLALTRGLQPGGFDRVAEAIMTTDVCPKMRSGTVGGATLVGVAKGAGMIEPNMATMLAYFFTDASIQAAALDAMFRRAMHRSFNMISVDSDTSTSDTAVIMANGHAGVVDETEFERVLTALAIELAKDIIRTGEGASKLIEVTVSGARTEAQATQLAKSVVNSPLVKTAVHGADPNWGRIAMALGKTQDPDVRPDRLRIEFGGAVVYDGGYLGDAMLPEVRAHLQQKEVRVHVDLRAGGASATAWGCDLSHEYIHINADYTT
jgi:glutamate N-acetyltransferase/amino-acid N-acetyltransferase